MHDLQYRMIESIGTSINFQQLNSLEFGNAWSFCTL